ncbi:5-deoxy-glucuronate isomerase [Nocardioides sp. GXZ039]|uniref:5-deoxy-glucuronate isomerase n=1 Tax=Nocardioides sp. GXZ039 TaxID=3136018 RepID=UPI0030F49A1F
MSADADRLVVRAGATSHDDWALDLDPDRAEWDYCGLRIVELDPGGTLATTTGGSEAVLVPLQGAVSLTIDPEGIVIELSGRDSVFAGPTDVAYVPRDSEVHLRSAHGGRFALCTARCERRLDPVHLPAAGVALELRGAGRASRQVHGLGMPGVLAADRILVCEVLTPGGNWSSWPPHKHDEESPEETRLEEIYYFEIAPGAVGDGVALHQVRGHRRPEVDLTVQVRTGDVVLVPEGWHGPSVAAPGHDLYYLNVMAGPGAERAWRICDDPDFAWVREEWAQEPVDPRLPFDARSAVPEEDR